MTEPALVALVLALLVLAGVPWGPVAALGAGAVAPGITLAAVVASSLIRRWRRPVRSDEAVVLAAIGAELRRGASLRTALGPAADRGGSVDLGAAVRLAEAGAPIGRVGAAFAEGFPTVGGLAGPAFEAAAASGGRAAGVFARLAERAGAIVDLDRERAALTIQARLSAAVVGGIPCVVLAAMAVGGRLGSLTASGVPAALAVGVGSLMMVAGVVVVLALTRRVLR